MAAGEPIKLIRSPAWTSSAPEAIQVRSVRVNVPTRTVEGIFSSLRRRESASLPA